MRIDLLTPEGQRMNKSNSIKFHLTKSLTQSCHLTPTTYFRLFDWDFSGSLMQQSQCKEVLKKKNQESRNLIVLFNIFKSLALNTD